MPFGPNAINPGYGQSQNTPTGLSNEVIASNPAQTPGNFVITGGSIDGTPIGLTTPAAGHFTTIQINTPLTVANGGTGVSSTPTNGQLLIGNGSGFSLNTLTAGTGMQITNSSGTITLQTTGGSGTVTSVDVSGGTTGLTFSGGPVTSSGTITLAGTLAIESGGTSATTAAAARSNLGVTATGADTTYAFRANNLSDLASAATARTNLGLGGLATLNTVNVATTATGGISGILPIANGGTSASTASDARTALGVSSTGSDTTYAFRANNLSDLSSAATARTNLGLGTISTQAASSVSITGGNIDGTTIGGTTKAAGSFTTLTATGTTTLATSLTGLLKATSGVVSAASSGTDYAPATSGSNILAGNGSGGFTNVSTLTGLTYSGSPSPTLSVNWASPGTIGSTAANTGAFTTLSVSGTSTLTGKVSIDGAASTYQLNIRRSGGAGQLSINIDNATAPTIDRAVQYYAIGDATNVITGHVFYARNNSATDVQAANITSTGLNNTVIGATTPAAATVTLLTTTTGGIRVATGTPIYLDGGGDTYLQETVANQIQVVTGGAQSAVFSSTGLAVTGTLSASGVTTVTGGDLRIGSSTAAIYLGTPSANYIYFNGTNVYHRVGSNDTLTVSSTGLAVTGTLGTTGTITVTKATGQSALSLTSGTTAGVYMSLGNSSGIKGDLGTGDQIISGGSASDIALDSRGGNVLLSTASVVRATISSTGLTVAGNLTFSGSTTQVAISNNTSYLDIYGGGASTNSARLQLFGASHATFPAYAFLDTDVLTIRSGNGASTRMALGANGADITGYVRPRLGTTTVASLVSAATAGAGAMIYVSDASATTRLSTVAGGGSNKVMVFSDGTNWLIL